MTNDSKVNILMVDDQPSKLLSYEVILRDLGENLIKATSGKEALEHLLKNDIAVVLMDVSMPDIDGFELAAMIREHPRFQKTAIIFISGVHLTDVDRIKGYQRGAVDYISVPVVPELLRAKVSVFAELHRKTRQLESLNQQLEERVAERAQELRQVNRELSQRVTELETIMQTLPVGVCIAHDPDCTVITGNAAISKLFGIAEGENLSKSSLASSMLPYEIYQDGQLLAPEAMPLERSAATGKPTATVEMEVRRNDGRSFFILGSASPLFDDEHGVRGAVGAFFDITEHKHMEDMLRERADLLELASEAIMVRTATGKVKFWNSGAAALYGWKKNEILGKNLHEVLRSEFPIPLQEIEIALSTSGSWSGTVIQHTKDGAEVVVACRKAFNATKDSVLEINRDITQQTRAQNAIRKTEKLAAMGRIAGIVAHEINNPLEAITNVFYLLKDHPSLDKEARRLASMGDEELRRLAHITKQTLSFYRESQQAVPIHIADLVDDVLELQARPMQMHRIKLCKQYRSKGAIHGYPVELKQVFLNLIGNAIQAMSSGGTLKVRVFDRAALNGGPAGTCVSICDTGSGISPDQAKRLFEPFFTTKAAKGTGLGLWISKGIIQKYEGTISFRSIKLSSSMKATCFSVFIPASFANAKPPELVNDSERTVERARTNYGAG